MQQRKKNIEKKQSSMIGGFFGGRPTQNQTQKSFWFYVHSKEAIPCFYIFLSFTLFKVDSNEYKLMKFDA